MTKQKRVPRGVWIAGIFTALYLPGSIWRLVTMPPAAKEPLPAKADREVLADNVVLLNGIGTAKINAVGKVSGNDLVTYSPNGALFTFSPFKTEDIDPPTVSGNLPLYVVQASIQGNTSHIFNARLDAMPEFGNQSFPAYASHLINVADNEAALGTWFISPVKDWSVRIGIAQNTEARTIAETPLWNPLAERFGEDLRITMRSGVQGATGAKGFTANMVLPPALTARLKQGSAAIKVQKVDWLGNAHDLGFAYQPGDTTGMPSDSLQVRVFNTMPASVRSLRVVAAPLNWTVFRRLPTKPKRYLRIAPFSFPVTKEALDFVNATIPSKKTLVIAETNRFPNAEMTVPVHDAIVIADGGKIKDGPCAQFYTYIPQELFGKAKMVAVLTDKYGKKHETEQMNQSTGEQGYNTGTIRAKWYFPEVPVGDERSLALELRR